MYKKQLKKIEDADVWVNEHMYHVYKNSDSELACEKHLIVGLLGKKPVLRIDEENLQIEINVQLANIKGWVKNDLEKVSIDFVSFLR